MTEPTKRGTRRAHKIETLGLGAACAHCGEREILCLHHVRHESQTIVLCANCRAAYRGKGPSEAHHVMGQHNSEFTVSITPNDHAVLSDYQYDWPKETLRNPNGSPLRIIAALLRGWLDLLSLVTQHALSWIGFLEDLDQYLANTLGFTWWTGLPSKEHQS